MFIIDAITNKVLKSVTTMKCKDIGDELYPEQIGNYLLYGNKKVIFSKEEMKKIKMMEDPEITLMDLNQSQVSNYIIMLEKDISYTLMNHIKTVLENS